MALPRPLNAIANGHYYCPLGTLTKTLAFKTSSLLDCRELVLICVIMKVRHPMKTNVRFSVVIPAYNEERFIAKTVASLKHLTTSRDQYEIIVVDNNSADNTTEAAKRAGADIVVTETTKGTNFARQRGVDESHGAIIAFLDADSQAPQDWLMRIEKVLNRPGVAAVGGTYDHGFQGWRRTVDTFYTHTIIPRIPKVLHFFFRKRAGVLIGGNFATWRWALDKVGGLPPLAFYGDDAATAMLLSRHVGKVIFDPTITVKSSPRRFEKHGMFMQAARYAFHYFKVYFQKWEPRAALSH